MPSFNDYNQNGRELLVRFTCSRCGKVRTEELEPLDKKAGDHYGYLSDLPLPKGWSDYLIHSRLLCDDCTDKLYKFFKGGGTEP
jgi:hypothetical protein